MPNMHPIMVLAFGLLGAVVLAFVSNLASAPAVLPVDPRPAHGGEAATPNHDPHRVRLMPQPTTKTAEEVATPNHDRHRIRLMPQPTIETAEEVATPNHGARLLGPMAFFALNPVTLRAEPGPAAPSAPTFVGADTKLYAKEGARLRAAPSIAADVLASLKADAPFRAIARSTDGSWWRVSLADGRVGYVHRTAVTQYPVVKTPPPTPAVATVASPNPVSTRSDQGLMDYLDETMDWLVDTAARGSAPAPVRTER